MTKFDQFIYDELKPRLEADKTIIATSGQKEFIDTLCRLQQEAAPAG